MKAWTVGDPAYGIPGGFPASKATIGFPFYYRGWTGVPAGATHGLYQTSTGGSPPMTLSGSVPGIAMYKEITSLLTNPADTFFDPTTQASYWYDGTNFYTGDSPQSIQAKANYLHCNGYAGAMMFSLYDLDPAATLFNDVVTDVNGSAPTCTGQPTPPPTTAPPTTSTADPPPRPTADDPAARRHARHRPGPRPRSSPAARQVSENGHQYTAKWWTQGDDPATHHGTVRRLDRQRHLHRRHHHTTTDHRPTHHPPPTTPPTTAPPTTPPPTGTQPWAANHAYTVGTLVTYAGHTYKCLQSHTSQVGWEPPNVPALWQLVS